METVHRSKDLKKADRKWIYALVGVFLISRFIIYLCGISFDANNIINGTWQVIDTELLKNQLLESLWYLHSQPPLYNLYIGLVLKLFPESYTLFFHSNFILLGLLTHVILFIVMRTMGIRPLIAFILTTLLMISPSMILYENWLSYTQFVMALLTFSTFFLLRFLHSEKMYDGFVFFMMLTILILTRSMYHIVWFVACFLILIISCYPLRRRILISALFPFLIVFSLFFKNYILFNTFSTSSWMGMSLYEISLSRMDKQKFKPLISSGKISPIVMVPAFWSLDHYKEFVTKKNPYSSIRVLTDSFNTREANYHNYHYLEISDLYKKSAVTVIQHYPLDYLKNVAISFGYYFIPASNYPLLKRNSEKMFWYNKIYNHLVLWTIYNPDEMERNPPFQVKYALSLSLLIIGLFVTCSLLGCQQALKYYRLNGFKFNQKSIVIFFITLTILYTMVVGNFFEQGENMRFRFQTSTLCIILLGLCIETWISQYHRFNQEDK